MTCPDCNSTNIEVIYDLGDDQEIECQDCGHQWSTDEAYDRVVYDSGLL